MQRRKFAAALGTALGLGGVGASAFTSASVQRDVSINVVADDATNAALKLTAQGGVGGATINSTTGQLELDMGTTANSSVAASEVQPTRDGTFKFGDPQAPSSSYSFKIINQTDDQRSLKVSLSLGTLDSDENFSLILEDSNGNLATADKGGSANLTLSSGETVYVAIRLTTGEDTGTITGTLSLDVGAPGSSAP